MNFKICTDVGQEQVQAGEMV